MNLVLTSDFPSTAIDPVCDRMRRLGANPLVAWIPPRTATGRERFPAAQAMFRSLGIATLEICDIDEEADERRLARFDRYDALYFTGGDPLIFRQAMERHGIAERVRDFASSGRLVVAASGGAMQLATNVSLYRLLSAAVDIVVAERDGFGGLGLAELELLPHLNRLEPAFIAKVQRYSERVPCDIVALEDGAALVYADGDCRCFGRAVRFRDGAQTPIHAD